jgi:glycosyltransferase involved in cell wall biosynthesis
MAAHKEEGFVGKAIKAILAQTLADFELIVIGDGSRDRTADVVRSFKEPRFVHLVNRLGTA